LVAHVLGTPCIERRISLAEFHAADEVFTTGTMGELTPVTEIDGRPIGDDGKPGPIVLRLQEAYRELTMVGGVPIPAFSDALIE
jgi:branched-subunit amino acid aminotransferase/4-amino-4-deoxychorismate lyase